MHSKKYKKGIVTALHTKEKKTTIEACIPLPARDKGRDTNACAKGFFPVSLVLRIQTKDKRRRYLFEGKRAFCACIGISSLVPCW